jgi:hypothetical protein
MRFAGMPEGGALVRPTAFHFEGVEQHTFVCSAHSRSYRRLLPPGLELGDDLLPEDTVMVSIIHYASFHAEADPDTRIGYDELVIALPCRHETIGPASYVPFIYLNEFRPTVYGRELFGYPKKLANVSIVRAGEQMHGSASSDLGYELASLSWKAPAGETPPGDTPAPRRVINWRRFPGSGSTLERPTWAVDELTAHRVSIDRIYSVAPLEVEEKSVKLFGGREDPLHEFGELTTLAATRMVLDWSIPEPPTAIEDFSKR